MRRVGGSMGRVGKKFILYSIDRQDALEAHPSGQKSMFPVALFTIDSDLNGCSHFRHEIVSNLPRCPSSWPLYGHPTTN